MKDALTLLRSNTSFRQWGELDALMETSGNEVKNSVLNIYYKQMKKLKVIDTSSIRKSKGVFKKLSFYEDLEKALNLLGKEKRVPKDKLGIITLAKNNLIKLEKYFADAFKLSSEILIATYEYTILAILDATSTLITLAASKVVKNVKALAKLPFDALNDFNKSVKDGKISHAASRVNEAMLQQQVVQEGVITSTLAVVAAGALVLAFIPLVRELVFYFYYVRMAISDYLDQLSMYLKINEVEVKNNPEIDSAKKKDILAKQDAWIRRLDELSDKIRVQQTSGEKSALQKLESEDSKVNLKNVKDEITQADVEPPSNDGFDF